MKDALVGSSPDYLVTFGGWYQRTTLHLSEVYDFFAFGCSRLPLSTARLTQLHLQLNLKEISREVDYLEYVKATTNHGIEIKYYEDGLYVLKISSRNIKESELTLKKYFSESFEPAIAYLFSLGAPTPKVLANLKTTHPTAIGIVKEATSKIDLNEYGEIYSTIQSDGVTVYKTPDYIFISASPNKKKILENLIETQIFFREFKDQLQRYLEIHRKVWEEIASIKERQTIAGKEVEKVRDKLDEYQKTINLINSRINQMGVYLNTRASITKKFELETYLIDLFQYKFEVLANTLAYIQEIWKMTIDYLLTGMQMIKDIEDRTTNTSIQSLQVITSIGVVSGILGYLAGGKVFQVTPSGMIYFSILVLVTLVLNLVIATLYRNWKYRIKYKDKTAKI
jgi:hypothetical protein